MNYLERFDLVSKEPVVYDDLLRFSGAISVFDKNDQDTLWIRVYYNEFERKEIDLNLKKVYSLLYSDGNTDILKYLPETKGLSLEQLEKRLGVQP